MFLLCDCVSLLFCIVLHCIAIGLHCAELSSAVLCGMLCLWSKAPILLLTGTFISLYSLLSLSLSHTHTHTHTHTRTQIRLLFNRKNKTLRAVLNTKSVLKLLEQNRKTVQALTMTKNTTTTGSNNNNTHSKDDERSVQDIVLDIVEREPWKGQRASKMSLDDFLQLLTEFNQAGIHFS